MRGMPRGFTTYRELVRFSLLLPVLYVSSLWAQDAGTVLSTFVDYSRERASLKLSAEQAEEADRIAQEAQREAQAGRNGEAMRLLHKGTALMRGVPWSPAVELASSLVCRLDHTMVEPGSRVVISFTPLYPVNRAVAEKVTAAVVLNAATKELPAEKNLAQMRVDAAHVPLRITITAPSVPEGDYNLKVRLALADVTSPQGLGSALVKNLPMHMGPLSAEMQRLRTRIAKTVGNESPGWRPPDTCLPATSGQTAASFLLRRPAIARPLPRAPISAANSPMRTRFSTRWRRAATPSRESTGISEKPTFPAWIRPAAVPSLHSRAIRRNPPGAAAGGASRHELRRELHV